MYYFYESGCSQKALKNTSSHLFTTFKPNNTFLNKTWLEPQ